MRKYWKHLVTASFLVALVAGYFKYQGWQRKKEYMADVAALYATGAKLGWVRENHLQFNRIYYQTSLVRYDVLVLFFEVTEPLGKFSARVDTLDYGKASEPFTIVTDTNFVYKVSDMLPLTLTDEGLKKTPRNYPTTTEWELHSPAGKRVTIIYADGNSHENTWIYNHQPLQGNIVQIELHRMGQSILSR